MKPGTDESELEEELARTWEAQGIDVESLVFRGETIIAPQKSGEASLLPALLTAPEEGAPPQLELGELLGEGGMGVVRAAVQTSLHREVAVKTARPERGSKSHDAQLLREGRVTGLLEHPNVVPVHALGQDETGRPLLVMKRIEGTAWSTLLGDVQSDERMSESYLRTHLHILRQVSAAVDFAHSRGILHRDIKPSNVMIGSFSEVYVLDWGVAVSMRSDRGAGVPHVSDVRSVEGTPVYMAPEMVAGNGEQLGVCSDVYLLGATLHHVITGEPPHAAPKLPAVLMHAFVSQPAAYDELVPRELATIVRRAMARDPSDRFETAAAFAAALDDFLLHRGSLELCLAAERRADELAQLVGTGEEDRVETLFHEARFGFEQALRSWPDNERASLGRRDLLETMVMFELGRGAPRVALGLLRQHDSPPEGLEQRIEAAIESERTREQRLAQLEHDVDRRFGVGLRIRLAFVAAASWSAVCLGSGALSRYEIFSIDHTDFAVAGAFMLAGTVVSLLVSQKKMLANATNRRIAFTTVLVFGSAVVMWPILGAVGLSMPQTSLVASCFAASLWATAIFQFGRAWIPMPAGHALIAVGIWLWPAYHFEVFALTAVPILLTAWLMLRDAGSQSTERSA